jgi:TolA-binding protein
MIDVQTEARCKDCDRPIARIPGRRPREFCNAVCKQRYHRKLHKPQAEANDVQRASEAAAQIATLEKQVRDLQARLVALQDVNERFRNDTRIRAFAPWLEKRAQYYAESSFGQRFLADRGKRLLPPSASRANYERIMRYTLKYAEDEIEMFREAWREMLKTQF